jgi:hypothetical protein
MHRSGFGPTTYPIREARARKSSHAFCFYESTTERFSSADHALRSNGVAYARWEDTYWAFYWGNRTWLPFVLEITKQNFGPAYNTNFVFDAVIGFLDRTPQYETMVDRRGNRARATGPFWEIVQVMGHREIEQAVHSGAGLAVDLAPPGEFERRLAQIGPDSLIYDEQGRLATCIKTEVHPLNIRGLYTYFYGPALCGSLPSRFIATSSDMPQVGVEVEITELAGEKALGPEWFSWR